MYLLSQNASFLNIACMTQFRKYFFNIYWTKTLTAEIVRVQLKSSPSLKGKIKLWVFLP